MAWPWLTIAVKSIPWSTLVRRAPDIIDAAGQLLASRKAGQAAARTEAQLGDLGERIANLEGRDWETAEVVNQIAAQTQDLTNGLGILAAKVRVLSLLLVLTLVLAIIAIGITALQP